jgi:hypothetical protein
LRSAEKSNHTLLLHNVNLLKHFGMRKLSLVFLALFVTHPLQAADSCVTIHGRAHLYGGDGQLRIWHIGTHHDYEPDESSWSTVVGWLEAGVKDADKPHYVDPAAAVYLFADFFDLRDGTLQKRFGSTRKDH